MVRAYEIANTIGDSVASDYYQNRFYILFNLIPTAKDDCYLSMYLKALQTSNGLYMLIVLQTLRYIESSLNNLVGGSSNACMVLNSRYRKLFENVLRIA